MKGILRVMNNYAPFIARSKKAPEFYKGIRQKTDSNLHQQIVKYIEKVYRGQKIKILDWGCGEGALSKRLSDLGYEVTGVDIEETSFKGENKFYCLDFNNSSEVDNFIKVNKGNFDLVVSLEVIEHVKSPWNFINDLKGFETDILITTPNVSSWWGRVWFFITGELWGFNKGSWLDIGHINPITKVELENILNEMEFEIFSVFMGGCLPVIWAYNWKRLLISIFMLPFRLIMKGPKDGWVLCIHAKQYSCKL